MIDVARQYIEAGLRTLPASRDSKHPIRAIGKWKPYIKRSPTEAELAAWFANNPDALCILCGEASGNMEAMDFDAGGELFSAWWAKIPVDLRTKLVVERTRSGGWHVIYRCLIAICGNLKLAQRKTDEGIVTLIETRGEGGLIVCAPTAGYEITQGDLCDLPVLAEDERDVLLSAAWELNEYLPPVVDGPTCLTGRQAGSANVGHRHASSADNSHSGGLSAENSHKCDCPSDNGQLSADNSNIRPISADSSDNQHCLADHAHNPPLSAEISHSGDCPSHNGVVGRTSRLSVGQGASPPENADRPGDDFNRRGDVRAVLAQHGWARAGGGDNEYWRRPGKTAGWSATLKQCGEMPVLYVFSSNAHPFEADRGYSPFAVVAYLEHGGDFSAATRALSAAGFGQSAQVRTGGGHCDGGADISHLLAWADDIEAQIERVPDPGPIPDDLFDVPGFVAQVMDFCLATAPYPNRALAFCGAMTLLSFLTGRKVMEPGELRPNLYLLALAGSGAGKDHPRKLNARVLFNINQVQALGDKFASGEGIQDAMAQTPCMLFQNDEMDSVLRQINRDKEGTKESIPATLLTMYTTAGSVFPLRRKAGKEQAGVIDQPHLTLFGTATPKYFYESLSEKMLTDGFFARLIIIDVGKRGPGQRAGALRNIPDPIIETAEWWSQFNPPRPIEGADLRCMHPEPAIVPYEPQAQLLLDDFRLVTEREYSTGEERNDEVWKAVWARGFENAAKLALLRACSENHESPLINVTSVEWAIRFADHQLRRQLFLAAEHVYRSDFEDHCKQLVRVLREWQARKGEKWMPFWRISRKLKWSPKLHDEVRQALLNSREIEYEEVASGGRPSKQYRLAF